MNNIEICNQTLNLIELFKVGENHEMHQFLQKYIEKSSGSDIFNIEFDLKNELMEVYIPIPTDILKDLFTFVSRVYNTLFINLKASRLGYEICDWFVDIKDLDLCIVFKIS